MKKIIYTLLCATLVAALTTQSSAQTWRPRKTGLPAGFQAKTVYGEGSMMMAVNASSTVGSQMYYTPDTSTPFTASPSSLGFFTPMETAVVKSMGIHFVGSVGNVYKSHDNGHTWTMTGASGADYALYAYRDTLYASLGAGIGVAKMSTDTGNTWTDIHYTGGLATCFVKANGVLYVGTTGGIRYTADDGATWNSVTTTALTGTSIVSLAAFGGNVYCACSTGVYETTDNGVTWTNVLVESMFSLAAVDTCLIGGTALHGIYKSNQAGNSWATINTGLPFVGSGAYTTVNYISYNDNFLIASLQGDSAIYVTGLADLGLNPSAGTTAICTTTSSATGFTIFPNPATNFAMLQLTGLPPQPVTIVIYDAAGRIVQKLSFNNQNNMQADIHNLKHGMYYVQLTAGKEQYIQPLTIIR